MLFPCDVLVGIAFKLILDEPARTVPKLDHALDAVCRRDGDLHLVHAAVLAVIYLPVHDGKGEVPHIGVGGDALGGAFGKLIVLALILGDRAVDVRHSVTKLLGKVSAGDGRTGTFLPAVLCAFFRKLSQYHVGVIREILVDGKALGALAEMHPFRFGFDGSVTLL